MATLDRLVRAMIGQASGTDSPRSSLLSSVPTIRINRGLAPRIAVRFCWIASIVFLALSPAKR